MKIIKPFYTSYQNLCYLVIKTTPAKYGLFILQLRSIKLYKFSEEFARYSISFFIDFFFGYNQIELNKKSQSLIRFTIYLGFIQIITLAQDTINSVAQFIRILLKILSSHLRNGTPLFLDDIRVKDPKTIYNNKELSLVMKQYMIEYIQNLDKV